MLVATDADLAAAWRRHLGDLPRVTVHEGSIFDLECDAAVSPANSFGFMRGGIDGAYSRAFGAQIERRVRQQISEHHDGELVVGGADIVETGNSSIPYLVVAPTMRVPMRLVDTVHPYLAARAVFRLVLRGHFTGGPQHGHPVSARVHTVAMPGLGTGVGGVPPHTCAAQVRAAYDSVVLERYEPPESLEQAAARHAALSGRPYLD